MSDTPRRTPEAVLRTYFRAKDENRPHLMAQVFSGAASLEMIVKTSAITFPPVAQGLPAITDVLVRQFGRTYENIYSFYLERPSAGLYPDRFSCDWLVGMSEKDGGKVRVGCGRYDWRFQSQAPRLAEGLVITIEAMQVLAPDSLEPVLHWLTGLPYPWCPPETILAAAPDRQDLDPVFRYVGRRTAV